MEIHTPARAEALAHPYATRTTGPRLPKTRNPLKTRLRALVARLRRAPAATKPCCPGACC